MNECKCGWELVAAGPSGRGPQSTAVVGGMKKGPTPPPAMAALDGVATPDDGLGRSSSPLGVLEWLAVVGGGGGCGSAAEQSDDCDG